MIISTIDESQRKAANVVGFTYLFALVPAIFAEFYVRSQLVVFDNAATTALHIVTHERLFRLGIASNLTAFAIDVALITALYVVLKPVHRSLALLAAGWGLIETAILVVVTLSDFDVACTLSLDTRQHSVCSVKLATAPSLITYPTRRLECASVSPLNRIVWRRFYVGAAGFMMRDRSDKNSVPSAVSECRMPPSLNVKSEIPEERRHMKPKTILMRITLAVALVLVGTLPVHAQESLYGTWKMNAAKSKYSPGPIPKSNIAKWEEFQGGVKLTVDVVTANGDTQHYESSGKFDGKDNPVTGNNPDGDAMAFSKIDARTYRVVTKKGGKTTLTGRIVVAADGKTRITTQAGKNAQGQTVKNTTFYEKQ